MIDNPKDTLANIIKNWPESRDQIPEFLKKWGHLLSPKFDQSYLVLKINDSDFSLSEPIISNKRAKVIAYVPDPFLAVLSLENSQVWLLEIFAFQCTSCFGNGISGVEVCNVCGGSGWGNLGDIEFCSGEHLG